MAAGSHSVLLNALLILIHLTLKTALKGGDVTLSLAGWDAEARARTGLARGNTASTTKSLDISSEAVI